MDSTIYQVRDHGKKLDLDGAIVRRNDSAPIIFTCFRVPGQRMVDIIISNVLNGLSENVEHELY